MDERSRVLQFKPYIHDTCLVETLTTLCVGVTVCSPSEAQRTDGLADFMKSQDINWAALTPYFFAPLEPHEVPTLYVIVLAGERLNQSNIDEWAGSKRLLSGYGVSKCSVVTTINRPAEVGESPSNIGLPAGQVLLDGHDITDLRIPRSSERPSTRTLPTSYRYPLLNRPPMRKSWSASLQQPS